MSNSYIKEVNAYLESIQNTDEYIWNINIHLNNLEDAWTKAHGDFNTDSGSKKMKIIENEIDFWTLKLNRELKLKSLGI